MASENTANFQTGGFLGGDHEKALDSAIRGYLTYTCTERQSYIFQRRSHVFLLSGLRSKYTEIAKKNKSFQRRKLQTRGPLQSAKTFAGHSHRAGCLPRSATMQAFIAFGKINGKA